MANNLLTRDITGFMDTYSKFVYKERPKMKCAVLRGVIDICDVDGNYWDSFNVEIYIDKRKYPYCVPQIYEVGNKIKRDENWHISEKGLCCLDIDHELEYLSKKGINITSFYQEKIYPFFTNALYKIYSDSGIYANEEYKHGFEGIVQFYSQKLKLNDFSIIIKILNAIMVNNIPGRNQLCICGSGAKSKHCHLIAINFLKSLSKERVQKDLIGFNIFNKKTTPNIHD